MIKLPDHININDYDINLVENMQTLYNLIYNLKLVKLKNLKTCIIIKT